MHPTLVLRTLSRCGLLAALALPACTSPVDEHLRAEFHAALGHTTITVYPACVQRGEPGGAGHDAASAERFGAWLTERGLATVSISTEEVVPSDATKGFQYDVFRATAAAFGEHVRQHGLTTAYALMPEYLITRTPDGGSRAGGIQAYVVDAQGRLVDALVLNSHHEIFSKAAASTPAECTEVAIAALSEDWLPQR